MNVTIIDIVIIWGSSRILDLMTDLFKTISYKKVPDLIMNPVEEQDSTFVFPQFKIDQEEMKKKAKELFDSDSHEVEMTVECSCCRSKKILKASDGPHGIILCSKDGSPMLPVRATAKPKKPRKRKL